MPSHMLTLTQGPVFDLCATIAPELAQEAYQMSQLEIASVAPLLFDLFASVSDNKHRVENRFGLNRRV